MRGRENSAVSYSKADATDLAAVDRRDDSIAASYWIGGQQASRDDAIRRAQAYQAAGASGIFVPGAPDEPTIRALVDAVDLPLNLLFVPGQLGLRRLGELGVRRVSCGSLLFRVALHAAVTTLSQIREGDPVETPGIPSYAEIQALVPGGS